MKILITGAWGFLGKHLQRALHDAPWPKELLVPNSVELDLMKAGQVNNYIDDYKPDVVIHLAARVGGIGANMARPADFWRDNLLMGINVLDACKSGSVKRLVMVGTTCSYPAHPLTIPFIEAGIFDGYPEPTNAPYGIAKRALMVGADAYRSQYGLDYICLVPTNLYGQGDNFDSETSHVIPAMFKKIIDASRKGENVTLWGTGSATRDFLYVEDAADAIVRAIKGPSTTYLTFLRTIFNLGSGVETRISTLAGKVAEIVGFKGRIDWDTSKPDGQPRRCLDSTRAEVGLGWKAGTDLDTGLRRVYESICAGARTQ